MKLVSNDYNKHHRLDTNNNNNTNNTNTYTYRNINNKPSKHIKTFGANLMPSTTPISKQPPLTAQYGCVGVVDCST
jgi:hypothetical protein